MKRIIKLTVLALVVASYSLKAQDTITVDLGDKTKIVIYTKDREGLKRVQQLDLNQIIREVTANMDISETPKTEEEVKVYEYEFDPDSDKLTLRVTVDTLHKNKNYHERYRHERRSRRFWAVDFGVNNFLEDGKFPDVEG